MIKTKSSIIINFIKKESFSGYLLFGATITALIWANSPFGNSYQNLWTMPLLLEALTPKVNLQFIINDGLMTIFFLLAGLEIKREFLNGELATKQKRKLPVIAAMGGMIIPITIYIAFNHGTQAISGWGIPMATDIAFSIGILSLIKNRIPLNLIILLTAIAIIDDLGAILVIALFYTEKISVIGLGFAIFSCLLLFIVNRAKMKNRFIYYILGLFIWISLIQSGIHATISGVILAFFIPSATSDIEALTPADIIENRIHPVVSYLIIPLFALANAGITIHANFQDLHISKETSGIFWGLYLGKPLGIFLFSFTAVKLKLASLPNKVGYKDLFGLGIICGIGFTMSFFINTLSFDNAELIANAKIGVIGASFASAITGLLYFLIIKKFNKA